MPLYRCPITPEFKGMGGYSAFVSAVTATAFRVRFTVGTKTWGKYPPPPRRFSLPGGVAMCFGPAIFPFCGPLHLTVTKGVYFLIFQVEKDNKWFENMAEDTVTHLLLLGLYVYV